MPQEPPRTIPKSALVLTKRTRRLYLSWWTTHYAVGMGGVIAGTLLTALTSAGGAKPGSVVAPLVFLNGYAWLIGIVAAVCTSLVTFLGPIHKAERYWSAYHLLDQACLEYEESEIDRHRFLARIKQARRILQAADGEDKIPANVVSDIRSEAEAIDRGGSH